VGEIGDPERVTVMCRASVPVENVARALGQTAPLRVGKGGGCRGSQKTPDHAPAAEVQKHGTDI
jgi:hypothetical protein